MAAGDKVRTQIAVVEKTLKETDVTNACYAIVDALKEIATALDEVERRANRSRK